MQTLTNGWILGLILAVAASTASAADPAIGTWKMNVAKSNWSPDAVPKSQIRTYTPAGESTKLTVKTVSADGKETTITLTFKLDGKPYPAAGAAQFDMVAVTQVDAMTVNSTQSKGGKTVSTGVRTVSKDGKTLTYEQKGTHPDGTKFDDVSVYDRQ